MFTRRLNVKYWRIVVVLILNNLTPKNWKFWYRKRNIVKKGSRLSKTRCTSVHYSIHYHSWLDCTCLTGQCVWFTFILGKFISFQWCSRWPYHYWKKQIKYMKKYGFENVHQYTNPYKVFKVIFIIIMYLFLDHL